MEPDVVGAVGEIGGRCEGVCPCDTEVGVTTPLVG
jgi:hypothetical protein